MTWRSWFAMLAVCAILLALMVVLDAAGAHQ